MADIPQQLPHATLVVNDTNDNDKVGSDNDADDTESNDSKSDVNDNAESNDDKPSDLAVVTVLDGNKPDQTSRSAKIPAQRKGCHQEVCQLQSANGSKTSKERRTT